jgi:hypothetical protein
MDRPTASVLHRQHDQFSLTLDARDATSPAAQALLADASARVAPLRVGDRFPVRPPWKPAALLPVGAGVLALLFFFWNPRPNADQAQGSEDGATPPAAKADIDKQMKQLVLNKQKKPEDRPTAEDLERSQAEVDKFARKPRDTSGCARSSRTRTWATRSAGSWKTG